MFDKSTGGFREKKASRVEIRLVGKDPFEGEVFHVYGERVLDLLNDPRGFIPVRRPDGSTLILAKSQIAAITEIIGEETPDVKKGDGANAGAQKKASFDPYKTLRITPGATSEEVRAAFNARIKAVHPDTIASYNLDEDIAKAASVSAQKIIYAYRKILSERREKPDADLDQNNRATA